VADTKPPLKTLLTLAWPIVISRSSQTVIGLSDALFVAVLGDAALAAVTTGALNTMSVLIFPMGLVFIVSSFTAQLMGEGKPQDARRYGVYGLVIAVATQVVAIASIPLVPHVLAALPYAPDVRELLAAYMRIRLLSTGAAIGIEALGAYYGGLGNTRLPMLANVVAMALNVALCWLLVFGGFGFPAMGVAGSAWASVFATFAGLLVVLIPFLRSLRGVRFQWGELVRMMRFGVPSGLNWFGEFFAWNAFINVVVASLGTASLAALMSVMQLNSTSFMPAFGIASAGSIMVGQAIGEKRKDDVPAIVWLTLRTVATWQGVVGLAYVLFPTALLSLFSNGTDGSEFRVVGVRILMLSAAWQLFDATAMTYSESLRAAGDTTFAMWARLGVAWTLFLPATYVLVRVLNYGYVTATICIGVYLGMLALAMWLRFRTGKWRSIDLTGMTAG
jgi:MATE family multidrug resistance protein